MPRIPGTIAYERRTLADASARPSSAAGLAGAGILATLATALVLIWYACPVLDDYLRGSCINAPCYRYVQDFYFKWSGRWSAVGLECATMTWIDMVRWYPILLGALLFFQAMGVSVFWRMLLGGIVPRRQALLLTATTMALLWASLPSPAETWYWICGHVENQLSISLSLLLLGGLVLGTWEEISPFRAGARISGLALLALFVTGLHELIGLMLCLVLTVGTAVTLNDGRSARRRWAWVVVSLSALSGLAIVVVAPGITSGPRSWPRRTHFPTEA